MGDEQKRSALKDVVIYTDGAAFPNPGAGGYGVVLRFGQHKRELSGGFLRTTNNRMELLAAIVGLEALKETCRVTLYSDSQYVVESLVAGHARRWRENDWNLNADGTKKAKNQDLWERLLAVCERHEVEPVWIRGHAGIADNEQCDLLALEASKQSGLPPDSGFVEATPRAEDKAKPRPAIAHGGKIQTEGLPCRSCGIPVVKRIPKKRVMKQGQSYFYSWYLYCPGCKNMYMVEAAKVQVDVDRQQLFEQGEYND